MTHLADLQATIAGVAERVGPAVAAVGRASGVVVGPGKVLTSAHPLDHREVAVGFAAGHASPGRLAGLDPDLDLAVVEVDTGDLAPVGWSSETEAPVVGTPVLALANPGGRGLRVTFGTVSATGRSFRGPRGRGIRGGVEHTAPLGRGSAGGPLVDASGRLVGISVRRLRDGFALAVPATAGMRARVEALGRGESVRRPRLGVSVAPSHVARRLRRAVGLPERDGLLVRAVASGSPAERAGVEEGDLIVAAEGRPVVDVDALYEAIDARGSDPALRMSLVRGTEEREVALTFADEERA